MKENVVYVWFVTINDYLKKYDETKIKKVLSFEELYKARQYRFKKNMYLFIIGRHLLRLIISYYTTIDVSQISFKYNKYGKPELSNIFKYLDIHFNLSHSNDMVIIAICKKINVGVDLEYIEDDSINELINNQIFTLEEQKYLCSLSYESCKMKFYDFWTCKEAVMKLIGKGLSQLPNTIAIINPHCNNYIIKILDNSYNNIYFSKKIPDISNAVAHLVTMYENISVSYNFSSASFFGNKI